LYEIINSIFKERFSNEDNYKRADEIANITIGKTPPRGEHECFSTNDNDIKWVSISDLGKCGMYIYDTNEKLTQDAVNKYNVKIVPANTILLSFKLTVGRIAITTQNMVTNEAIAHFNLIDGDYMYYIYSYLNNFDYSKLGSTSSIATAVNSKIIKSMNIAIPDKNDVLDYNNIVIPIFDKIKNNEEESQLLSQLRDALLPKLMNGEIDLDNIEI
jgi:type I restriction enzyme S subunit